MSTLFWRTLVATIATASLIPLTTALPAHSAPVAVPAVSATIRPNASPVAAVSKIKISKQPRSVTVNNGKKATFTAKAKGGKVTYRWYVKKAGGSWKKVAGSKGSHKTFSVKASKSLDGAQYRVKVSSGKVAATSKSAKLTVIFAPHITVPVKSRWVTTGGGVLLAVGATGNALHYQWQVRTSTTSGWTNVAGATSATLSMRARTSLSGHQYRVIIKNKVGSVTTPAALLVVDSSRQDPYAVGKVIFLNNWMATVLQPRSVSLNDGTSAVAVDTVACYYGETSSAPWLDLDVSYIGNDSVQYDNAGLQIEGDIYDTNTVYNGGCVDFFAFAIVPDSAVSSGTWVIEDSSDVFHVSTQYVTGL